MSKHTARLAAALASLLLAVVSLAAAQGPAPAEPQTSQTPVKKVSPKSKAHARKRPARASRKTVKTGPSRQAHPAVKLTKKAQEAAVAPQEAPPGAAAPIAAAAVQAGTLVDFGASLNDGEDSAEALALLPGSPADALGLLPGDHLASLNGVPAHSRADAAAAWKSWDADLRLWAVARRGLRVVDLQSRFPDEEPAFARGPKSLSPRESVIQEGLLAQSAKAGEAVLAAAPPLQVSVPAKQVLWIRFPDGLRDTVATGDILLGEVTMAVASDASLDYLCLPPRSQVWGKVLQTSSTEGVKTLRVHFYKAALAGGHTIPISASITDASGEQPLLKVSPGGTLVLGEALSKDQKKRRGVRILEPDVRLRLELTDPVTVTEPPQFYPAGAGLWIKTKESEAGRVFEVTHVIAGRNAEKTGLRVGDMLIDIGGRATARMEFGEALAALYGAPGTVFKVTAIKPGADKPVTLELKRGVFYKDGVEMPAPLPFEKRDKAKV